MDYYQLHCFRVVAEYQHMTKAADALNISQPSLSQTIKRLETELGYSLFDREHKKIILNESGKYLYQKVCYLESYLEDTKNELDEMNDISKSVVTLHVNCASMLLPKLLCYLKENYPMIEFQVFQWNKENMEKNNDIWISAERFNQDDIILVEEEFFLAMPVQHPLAKKNIIKLKDLEGENFIHLTESWSLEATVHSELKKRGFKPHIIMQFDNPVLMREVLLNNLGLAFVPSITWNVTDKGNLAMKKVEDCVFKRKVYLHMPQGFISKEQKLCAQGIQKFFQYFNQDNNKSS